MKREKGFTLIELMVVVVIIGILAGVALPKFLTQQKKAKESGAWGDMDSMTTALEMYFLDNDEYPADLSALSTGTIRYIKFRRTGANAWTPEDPWGTDWGYDAYATAADGFSIYEGSTYDGAKAAVYINTGQQFRYP